MECNCLSVLERPERRLGNELHSHPTRLQDKKRIHTAETASPCLWPSHYLGLVMFGLTAGALLNMVV